MSLPPRFFIPCAFLATGIVIGLFAASFRAPVVVADDAPKGPRPEERLRELKLTLPAVTRPTNTLVNTVRVGDLLFVSGMGPSRPDGSAWVGRLGQNMEVKEGREAARAVGLRMLAAVKAELGSLDRVVRLVKTLGMVNATPEFKQQPAVVNGFSDLMVEVLGEQAGKGTRSAVGMASLPGGIPVEIEAIFQVRP